MAASRVFCKILSRSRCVHGIRTGAIEAVCPQYRYHHRNSMLSQLPKVAPQRSLPYWNTNSCHDRIKTCFSRRRPEQYTVYTYQVYPTWHFALLVCFRDTTTTIARDKFRDSPQTYYFPPAPVVGAKVVVGREASNTCCRRIVSTRRSNIFVVWCFCQRHLRGVRGI